MDQPAVLLIALATALSTLCGGVFALKFKDKLHLIVGFSAGAVVGVAFFDLLPEALNLSSITYSIETVLCIVAFGFSLYLILDRLVLHHCSEGHNHGRKGFGGVLTLSLHSLLDGMGIGLAFKISSSLGIVVALAVLAHDFSDGINTVSFVLKNNGDKAQAFTWLLIDALAPIVGIILTFFFAIPSPTLGLLLALFGGFFLYIGAVDLVPESHHNHPVAWTTIATLLGMGTMFVIISMAS